MHLTNNQLVLLLHIFIGTSNKYENGTKQNDLKVLRSFNLITIDTVTTPKATKLIKNMQNLLKYQDLGLVL